MWKNKTDNYYSFNLHPNDRYSGCKAIELFQIKNFRNREINIIIIYEVDNYPRGDDHRFIAKVSGKYPCGENGVDIGSHRVILSGNDLFMLKWECVSKAINMGWEDKKEFLSFLKRGEP